jgi:pyrroline-5-carboxylate reductase
MSTSLPPIALIGTGKMGGAILEGLVKPGVQVASLRATTRSEVTAELLRSRGVEAASVESEPAANEWAVAGARVVILAVKPHALLDVCRDIANALAPDAVVVSVAAGLTTTQVEAVVSHAVIRAMPNTPAQIGRGVTGIAAGSRVSAAQLAEVREIFELVGDVVEIPEDQINALSALSGSGPAYLFYFAEKLIDVALAKGFSSEQARTMVQGTLLGAAALLDSSGDEPVDLRRAVTSPGGTTERAIAVFDEGNLGELFANAIDRAIARAEELAKGS